LTQFRNKSTFSTSIMKIKSEMATCYLIIAHKEPDQVQALIASLYSPEDFFYVHIDRKYPNILSSLQQKMSLKKENIYLASHTVCTWGGISLVDVQIRSFSEILAIGIAFSHLIVISGQDYPLKEPERINSYLEANMSMSFLECVNLEQEWPQALKRATHSYFEMGIFNNRRIPLFKRNQVFPNTYWYGGSSWITLSVDVCEYVCFSADSIKLREFLKYSKCPDEFFFQTLLCNSEFSKNIVNNCLRHIEWGAELGYRGAHPKLFDLTHIHKLESIKKNNLENLFVRKIQL